MTTKEIIKGVLEDWGFPVLREGDNMLVFRYQMRYIQVNITESDEIDAVVLLLIGTFKAENEREMNTALCVCNDLNYHMLQVKSYIDSDLDLVIASEFFYDPTNDIEALLELGLQGLVKARKNFLKKYDELKDKFESVSISSPRHLN